MGLAFLMLFLGALAFYWYAGKVIDDVFEQCDREYQAWRERQDRRAA